MARLTLSRRAVSHLQATSMIMPCLRQARLASARMRTAPMANRQPSAQTLAAPYSSIDVRPALRRARLTSPAQVACAARSGRPLVEARPRPHRPLS